MFKILMLFAAISAHAETASRDSVAQVTGKLKGDAIVIKVDTPKGTHLNYDGPWRLTVTGDLPQKNGSGSYGKDAFDKKEQSFLIDLKEKPRSGATGEFALAYFLCSDDNVWCKRIEAKGEIK